MLESSQSLLPPNSEGKPPRVLVIGFSGPQEDEMQLLLRTLDVEHISVLSCGELRKIHSGHYIGQGKIFEAKSLAEQHNLQAAVIDAELSPNQLKNLETGLGIPTLDRPGVILEIFSRNARSKEAKTQVEVARLRYLLPRLTHYWSHFERQRGGGHGNRGMGEKQLEVDRRLLKNRLQVLIKRLEEIRKERKLARSGRSELLKVALVGYTNAGKSTLLNALTHSHELAENKLFSTLDSRVRALDPHAHPPIVAIDTVGFIRKIPTHLVASFRSTLEELEDADLLLHVVDASSPEARTEIETTEAILKDLELEEKPRFIVMNKMDLIAGVAQLNQVKVVAPKAMRVSALEAASVEQLRQAIGAHFRSALEVWEVVLPYSESRLEARLREFAIIENQQYLEAGTFYRLRIHPGLAKKLHLARFRTHLAPSEESRKFE